MDDLTSAILEGKRCMTCGMVLDIKIGNPEDCTECKKRKAFKRILEEEELKRLRAVNRLARRAG